MCIGEVSPSRAGGGGDRGQVHRSTARRVHAAFTSQGNRCPHRWVVPGRDARRTKCQTKFPRFCQRVFLFFFSEGTNGADNDLCLVDKKHVSNEAGHTVFRVANNDVQSESCEQQQPEAAGPRVCSLQQQSWGGGHAPKLHSKYF